MARQATVSNLLFLIENALRGVVVREMEAVHGARWWEKRMAPEVKSKVIGRQMGERLGSGLSWSLSHAVAYLDLPDLKQLIVKKDNWRDCFSKLFGQADYVEGEMALLEPIRNRVAHSRFVTDEDALRTKATWQYVLSAVTAEEVPRLFSLAIAPVSPLSELRWLRERLRQIGEGAVACRATVWPDDADRIISSWWFSGDLLQADLSSIEQCCSVLREYCLAPRYAGMGPDWMRKAEELALRPLLADSDTQLGAVIGEDNASS
ncbi:hypothetical protein LLH23_04915 [bacterium]|nr:hypothetical protein [bacterium]